MTMNFNASMVVYQVRFGSELYNGLPMSFVYNSEATESGSVIDFDLKTAYEKYMEMKDNYPNVVLTQTPALEEDDWIEFWEKLGCEVPYPEVVVIMKADN